MLQKSDLEDNIAEYIAERLPHAEIRVLFDIGANVGWFTSQFLRAYPNCECYLFEPVTSNYEAIPSTLNNYPETNPFPRTKCFRVALGLARPDALLMSGVPTRHQDRKRGRLRGSCHPGAGFASAHN